MRLELGDYRITHKIHKFQFHKGAIRTQSKLRAEVAKLNFNSIKVRLEQTLLLLCDHIQFNFNSIKVRLEQFNAAEAQKNRDISIP